MARESNQSVIALGIALAAAAASIFSAVQANKAAEQVGQLQAATEYTKLLTDQVTTIMDAFKANSDPVGEAKSSVMLLALFSQSNDYAQKVAVVSIGARAANAIPMPNTGGAAARFLDLTLEELQESAATNHDDAQVLAFMHSRAFFDILSSGVSRSYFHDSTPDIYPTVYGDHLILAQSKRELWAALTPSGAQGWLQVATWVDSGSTRKLLFNYTFDGAPDKLQGPFALNRARFIRDVAPRVGRYSGGQIGILGHVIGLADDGTCLRPLGNSMTVDVRVGQDDVDAALDNFVSIQNPTETHHLSFGHEASTNWHGRAVSLTHLWVQVERTDPADCASARQTKG